jgi:hypothetical protein
VRWIVLVAFLGACQGKGQEGADPKMVADVTGRIAKLQEQEGDVVGRRDELRRERDKVKADRVALEEKRKQVAAEGGDVAAVDQEAKALEERESALATKELELNTKIDTLMRGYQEVVVGVGGAEDVSRREAAVAVREKDYSRREDGIARREAEIAARERELAKRERETCSVQATTTIVQAAPTPPPGSKYSRRDVEPLLQKARRKMGEKGLMSSDLPAPAQALEREATGAMASGDYAKAKFAADQLIATIEGIKIDKAFIAAKINRLNGAIKGKTLVEDVRKQVDGLFRDATSDYGDGKFTGANAKLNRIWGLI